VNAQNRSLTYTYDDLYRLTDEAIVDGVNGNRTSHYVYDAVGNRDSKTVNGVTTAYAYDANDRLLTEKVGTATTVSYTYDNNGSTLTKVENGVTTIYTWNDEKRLVSATVGSTTTAEYVYNDQGIRVASKVNGVETRYLLDEGIMANVWEEYALNGTVQASYVYGNDLLTQTQATQTSHYLVDGLGSTRLLTDAQGQVLNAYGYEAFGETVSQSGTASNKYQYAGEQFDGAIGDYYLRQRFYDISSGRFSRMDTYEGRNEEPLTLHKYLYSQSNPAMGIDPTGLSMWSIADVSAAHKIANEIMKQDLLFASRFALDVGAKYNNKVRDIKTIVDFGISLYHHVQEMIFFWKVSVNSPAFRNISRTIGIWNPTKSKSSVQNAYDHWTKHRSDYPHLQNALQFVHFAKNFIKSPPVGSLIKIRANGEKVVYDPKTELFAVGRPNGDPKTVFIPDPQKHGYPTNLDYFNAQ
jgi:RHS repeat-associated protein